MNSPQKIAPIILDDSKLETKFKHLFKLGEWSIEARFRFHSTARCVRIAAEHEDTQRCVVLRADRSVTTGADCADELAGFNTAHMIVTDNQIPWAHGRDFQALQYAIAVADWISRFLCLTAEKPAIEAQRAIEDMCAALGRRFAKSDSPFLQCQ